MTGAATCPAADPARRVFLTAAWRDLVMLNYAVDPALLQPHVPGGTVLDAFRGRALVSLVGFRFVETRLLGVPIPFHRDFLELNLRFYVRRDLTDGPRRGVVFLREVVPRRAIAWVANTVYGEHYVTAPMRARVDLPAPHADGRGRAEYGLRWHGRWQSLLATVDGRAELPAPGSEAEFVTEHYFGYSGSADRAGREYRVEHPRWRIWPAPRAGHDLDVESLYGAEFAPLLRRAPDSAFVAEGSEVSVHRASRL